MKKDLHELLGWRGPITHRQYLAWQQWLVGYYGPATQSSGIPLSAAKTDRIVTKQQIQDYRDRNELNKALARQRVSGSSGVTKIRVDKKGNVLSVTPPDSN